MEDPLEGVHLLVFGADLQKGAEHVPPVGIIHIFYYLEQHDKAKTLSQQCHVHAESPQLSTQIFGTHFSPTIGLALVKLERRHRTKQ